MSTYIDGSTSSSLWDYQLVVELGTQDIVNNYTPVTVYAQVTRTSSTSYLENTGTINIDIDGNNGETTLHYEEGGIGVGDWRTIWSRSANVYHNSDGTKSIHLSSWWDNSGASPTTGSADGWMALPTIPRASSVVCNTAYIGEGTTITINRYSSSFTHTLKYSFVGLTNQTIATGVGTSYGWTIPTGFYAQIPNSTGATCTITCYTYSGGSLIGSSTYSFTASVNPTTNLPAVSATITDGNTLSKVLTDSDYKMVKFYSYADYSISATAKNSSTIASYSITNGSHNKTTASGTLPATPVNGFNLETATFTVSATDSRGLTNTVVYNGSSTPAYTLKDYVKLTITPTVSRNTPTDGKVNIAYTGNYWNDTFGTEANTLTIKYRYKEKGGAFGSWITLSAPTKSGNAYSQASTQLIPNPGGNPDGDDFDYTKTYTFEVAAYDKINTGGVAITVEVPQGKPVINWTETGFNVNGSMTIDDTSIFLKVYPVGAIYMSVANTSPATLFGGTWAAWGEGRVPLGVGSISTNTDTAEGSVTAGSINKTSANVKGGEKAHALTTSELPNVAFAGSGHAEQAASGTSGHWAFDSSQNISGGGTAHNNVQPYITCYMWERTA